MKHVMPFFYPLRWFMNPVVSAIPLTMLGQVFPPEFTEASLAGRVIDQALEVGLVVGSSAVSATGGASYMIPIQLPPGTNGVQPAVSIVYNSQGGDGILGWGWNIAGLSAISRTGTDWYHDGSAPGGIHGVTYGPEDRFALDGQRLMPLSGTYGIGSTYDTECASFSVITAVGPGPDYFTVVTKQGQVIEYGRTADSRLLGNGGSSGLVWRINRVTDPNGNYISYTYAADEGEHRLLHIDYTGNDAASITPYNRVEFTYQSRPDPNQLFVLGIDGPETTHLLASVLVRCEGAVMKTYDFNYSRRDIDKCYLREITETGSDGVKRLNSTVFKYAEADEQLAPPEVNTLLLGHGYDYYSGDFDGDGRSEILAAQYQNTTENSYVRYHTRLRMLKRAGSNLFSQTWEMLLPEHMTMLNHQNPFKSNTAHSSYDMNGDGRDDIILFSIIDLGGGDIEYQGMKILESSSNNATSFTEIPSYPVPTSGGLPYSNIPASGHYFATGDFNGDGLGDVLLVLQGQYGTKAFWYSPAAGINGGEVFFQRVDPQTGNQAGSLHSFASASQIHVVDIDGDGQDEIMCVPPDDLVGQGVRIFKWGNQPTPAFWMLSEHVGFPTAGHHLFPGDFNGDGKTDLLSRYEVNGEWNVSYSTGNDFGFGEQFTQFNADVDLDGGDAHVLTVADFNGDGRSDICHVRPDIQWNQLIGSNVDLFYSRGAHSDFAERSYFVEDYFDTDPALISDLNGDGRSELINTGSETVAMQVYFIRPDGHERSLDKVMTGMNAIIDFDYTFATISDETISNEEFTYPAGKLKLPIEVVNLHQAPDGVAGSTSVFYAFKQAIVDRTGRGFIGFMEAQQANPVMNTSTVSLYKLQPDYRVLVPYQTVNSSITPQQQISFTEWSFEHQPLADHRFLTKLLTTLSHDHLALTNTVQTNSYGDAYGNVTTSTTNVNNIEVTTTTANYIPAGLSTAWSKPETVVVSRTRTGADPVSKTSRNTYDPGTGNLLTTTEFQGSAGAVSTTYTYNITGTVRTKALSAPSVITSQWPSEKFRYDARHRFVREATRNWWYGGAYVDVTTITETDPKWGKPLSILSSDGMTTLMHYDVFGRLTETDVPHIAGSPRYSIYHSLVWAVDGLERFATLTVDPGGPDQTVFNDLLGRPVRSVTEGFGGQDIHAAKKYDERGNVSCEDTPHHLSEDYLTTTHSFDGLNRPYQDVNPLTGTTAYAYGYVDGQSIVTVTSPAGWSSTTTDAAGRTVKSADDGGVLKHEYDSWGNLLKVNHGADLVANNSYDAYGRQTSLWAPGAGTTNYSYNAFGKLVWQKDPNNNEVTLDYDNLGRLVRRYAPEGNTQYAYYNLNNRINDNLMFVIGPGVTRSYTYDAYNRLASATSIIAGQSYLTQYALDDYDRTIQQTYPSGLVINSTYDATGALDTRYWANGTLYRANEMNGLGQLTDYTMADGQQVRRYYTHGFLERINAPQVQDLNMGYDYSTGNMSYRWDALQLLKESFDYDELNRLTASRVHTTDFAGTPLGSPLSQNDYGYDGSIGDTRGGLVMRSDIGQLPFGARVGAAKNINYPVPYDQPPLVISQATQKITYTPFLKTATIDEYVNNDAYILTYEYGPEHQRTRSILTKNTINQTERIYLGEYEKQIINNTTQEIHYIGGGAGLCAMIVKTGNTWRAYATYTDHLGSIVEVTGALDGVVVARQNFDPWGRYRKATSWLYTDDPQLPTWLYRGFTGHEHVTPFSLINMNGRMYDPNTGRMMSVDNFVNGSSATQAYNRYTYASNNPLTYSDPTGDFILPLLAFGIVANTISAIQNASGSDAWMAGVGGAIIGAQTALLGGYLTNALAPTITGPFGGLIGTTISSGISGGYGAFGMASMSGVGLSGALSIAGTSAFASTVGSAIGTYVAGSAGAFTRGFVSSMTGSLLTGGRNAQDVVLRAAIAGGINFASYEIEMGQAFMEYEARGGDFNQEQWYGLTKAAQMSFGRGREYGGWLTKEGITMSQLPREDGHHISIGEPPSGWIAEWHTHPSIGGAWGENEPSRYDRANVLGGRDDMYVQGRRLLYKATPPAKPAINYSLQPQRIAPVQVRTVAPNIFLRYPLLPY